MEAAWRRAAPRRPVRLWLASARAPARPARPMRPPPAPAPRTRRRPSRSPAQADEQIARLDLRASRCSRPRALAARRLLVAGRAAALGAARGREPRSPRPRARPCDVPLPHRPLPLHAGATRSAGCARRASRATVTSSNGTLTPAGELLALLVALAGDHHHVVRRRQRDCPLDRRAAIDLDVHRPLGASAPARRRRARRDAGHDLRDDRLGDPPSAGCRR